MEIVKIMKDNVLVKPIPEADKTEGGIQLITKVTKTVRGEVLKVGEGVEDKNGKITPLEVQVGDVVYYRSDAGIKVEDLIVLREEEIMAIG